MNLIANWISVEDSLPEIPEGRYSVSVLVCEYDPCFEELCPNYGLSVNKFVSYGKYKEINTNIEYFGFHEMIEDGWIGCVDKVTHWMYLPDPPTYKTKYNKEKDRIDFIYEDNK